MGADPADEMKVRNLAWTFADIVNLGNFEDLVEIWDPSGVWQVPGFDDAVGVAAIERRLRDLLSGHEALVQLVNGGRVWLQEASGRARFYITEVARGRDGETRLFAGIYHDEVALGRHGWRFTRRRYQSRLRVTGVGESVAVPLVAGEA